jgi:methyltransferase (TIGR00027 family)
MVLLGAGLDNRADRLHLGTGLRVFEVDHPDMQRYKRERLAAAGVREDDRVFVPVNFETDRVDGSLVRAGFDARVPAFWIWEGVTPYLTELSAPRSRLCITYMRPPEDVGQTIDRLAGFLGGLVGEPLHGRYGSEEMASLLERFGFSMLSDESDVDLASRYWKDPPSAHPRSIHLFPEWERLAVAERVEA